MLELTAKVRLGAHTDPTTGQRTIRADIINVGEEPIGHIVLAFEYEYETPQDVSSEFDRPPGRSIRVEELGRQINFLPVRAGQGALLVGQSQAYQLPAESVLTVESVVASLSPERYRITITMNGRREVAVPGRILGGFIQEWTRDDISEQSIWPEHETETGVDKDPPAKAGRDASSDRMQWVSKLVARIVEEGKPLEILPPRELTHDATIFQSEEGFQRLTASQWCLRFKDGPEQSLSFTELMAVICRLMMLRWQYDELRRTGGLANELPVVFPVHLDVSRLTAADEVKSLLSALSFGESD